MSRRLLMLLVVIGIIWGGCSMGGGKAKEVQEGMQKYLQDTYGMEFVVGKPYMYGNEGTGYNYQAKAYPKGKPELEFFVEGDKFNTGVYIDGYLQVKWTYQGTQQLEKALKEVYGDDYYLDHYEFRYNNKEFKDLDYDEVLEQPDITAHIDCSYFIFVDDMIDKRLEAKKALEIARLFLYKEEFQYYFNVSYLIDSYKKNPLLYNKEYEQDKSPDDLHQERKLINWLHLENEQLDKVEKNSPTVDDIINAFRY